MLVGLLMAGKQADKVQVDFKFLTYKNFDFCSKINRGAILLKYYQCILADKVPNCCKTIKLFTLKFHSTQNVTMYLSTCSQMARNATIRYN